MSYTSHCEEGGLGSAPRLCERGCWHLTALSVKERGELGVLHPGYERGGLGFAPLAVRKEGWGLDAWV